MRRRTRTKEAERSSVSAGRLSTCACARMRHTRSSATRGEHLADVAQQADTGKAGAEHRLRYRVDLTLQDDLRVEVSVANEYTNTSTRTPRVGSAEARGKAARGCGSLNACRAYNTR